MSERKTIADIARSIGVSPSTVSRALRDHPGISAARKREVREAAAAIGFEVCPEPERPGSGLLGCVVPGITHPFYAQVVERLQSLCARDGWELILHLSGGSPASEDIIVRSLVARRVAGVFFIPAIHGSTGLKDCAAVLKTIVVTQQTDLCPSIGISHEEGGRLIAEHFIELGRRACLFVGPVNDPKLLGFRYFAEAQGLTDFRIETVDVTGFDERLSLAAYKGILEHFTQSSIRRFDCLFGYNDLAAMGALHAVVDLGRAVPGDIAVSGFDDVPLAREMLPGLTSVAQPVGQIAQAGYAMLQRLIRGETLPEAERSFSLKPHLVIRASSYSGP
jgi:Transcriptional regulators